MTSKSLLSLLALILASASCSDNSDAALGSGNTTGSAPPTSSGNAAGAGSTADSGTSHGAAGTANNTAGAANSTAGAAGSTNAEAGSCPTPSIEANEAVNPEATITIEVDSPKQEISVMGGDMERSAGFLDNATNPQEIADWFFKDIDFDFCRVSYDRKQELTEGLPTLSFYDKPISAMKKIKLARPDIQFWATMKSDYDGYGSVNNLPDWIYTGGGYNGGSYDPTKVNSAKYARFLANYLKLMSDNDVAISVLEVSKEWIQVFDPERERQTIVALQTLLSTAPYQGVPIPRFVGPGGWGVPQTNAFVKKAAGIDSLGLYTGVSVHSYDSPSDANWESLFATAASYNLPVWHSESTIGGGGPYSGGEPAFTKLITELSRHSMWYQQGLKGELFFENWSRGVSTETRIVYFKNGQAGVRLRGYYVMKQFANHAANSTYIPTSIDGTTGLESMAFRQGNQLTVWVINKGSEAIESAYTIQGAKLHGSCVSRLGWDTDAAITGVEDTLAPTGDTTFHSLIPAGSITSLVFDLN